MTPAPHRTRALAASISAALLLAAAGTRADVISTSSDFIQPGFAFSRPNVAPPIDFAPPSGGAIADFTLIASSSVPTPPGMQPTLSAHVGTGSLRFTDNAGLDSLLSFQYQMQLAARRRDGSGGTRATMDIALEGMSFAGLPSWIMIRESPTLSSVGIATVDNLGAGQFRIAAAFDIYTEISLDNGQSWIAASGPVQLDLIPTPSAAALIGLGGLIATRRRRYA